MLAWVNQFKTCINDVIKISVMVNNISCKSLFDILGDTLIYRLYTTVHEYIYIYRLHSCMSNVEQHPITK